MPFIQRVVQPVNLSQVNPKSGANAGSKLKFRCLPGKCKNNNCINREQSHMNGIEKDNDTNAKDATIIARRQPQQPQQQTTATTTVIKAIIHTTSTTTTTTIPTATPTATTTTVNGEHNGHVDHLKLNGDNYSTSPTCSRGIAAATAFTHNLTNGYAAAAAAASFTYATDTEEDGGAVSTLLSTPLSPTAGILPNMKKLKQHVEFLDTAGSTPTSPTRSLSRSSALGAANAANAGAAGGGGGVASSSASSSRAASRERRRTPLSDSSGANSPTVAKKVTGFEFDCISNITLSNALRQLASLVLIASDIFDDLQQELQQVGDRARVVQRKIVAVERRVYAYDPKKVTVPESDLFTFAQRKIHYESDKVCQNELFTAATRPQSVRVLYEDAGKKTPPPTISPRSTSFASADGLLAAVESSDGADAILDLTDTGAGPMAAGSDELVCTPVFGKANRKMRTRIDAEIEIRLPAAIEDLRKWTSTEALGDVTVTPDCMHHVDTSISTSIVIGDNGVLTPALSPSVLSADAVDALYSINVSNAIDSTHLPNDLNKDVPLNHRLPSPEEQCKIIALRYPAEVISVDTSGKRFERMCMARKSTTGCYNHTPSMGQSSAGSSTADGSAAINNLNEDIQTVSRRSRSRKVRGKRRNTIAGIDQKEIQDAANGDSTIKNASEIRNTMMSGSGGNGDGDDGKPHGSRQHEKSSKKFGRSKSSDILKKESVALPYDKGKNTLTRLNSLKQWGRNRFKFMQRNEASSVWVTGAGVPPNNIGNQDVGKGSIGGGSGGGGSSTSANTSAEKAESITTSTTEASSMGTGSVKTSATATTLSSSGRGTANSIECETQPKGEARFSHERKPSYSSSEKSMSVSSCGQLRGKLQPVKLRDTSTLNRQRRNGISANGLGGNKDEQPHSSSGNWSASSESGRASIGSEITMQPKSSASNTSLNVSSFHPSSGPPSSMLSRRRFLNTSASSSVTSEGTATPDLQHDGAYPNHLDDETSSAYSCDTEGYYTSFHMDSGLRTLKEEEPTLTPLQLQAQSNYSFGSQSNQTVLSAENEYELFGKGSTSTTTSSAGTVCTTLMLNGSGGERSSLSNLGPDVPERISSLSKLKSNSASSSSTLERSYSSSTIGSTLERTGTIKRNGNASLKLVACSGESIKTESEVTKIHETPESHEEEEEEEFNFEHRGICKRAAQPLPEVECSECSDLEGVERIERIKQKTAMTARRIPSMCIITPTTSDDENHSKDNEEEEAYDPNRTLTNDEEVDPVAEKRAESLKESNLKFTLNESTGYCTVDVEPSKSIIDKNCSHGPPARDHNLNNLKSHQPSTATTNFGNGFNNMFGKLKVVLPNIKLNMPGKSSPKRKAANIHDVLNNDELYDAAGEYVTIADISNNNRRHHSQLLTTSKPAGGVSSSLGIYYSNDIVRRQLEGNEPKADTMTTKPVQETTEYVSMNELPYHIRKRGMESGAVSALTKPPNAASTASNGAEKEHGNANANENRTQRKNDCAVAVSKQPRDDGGGGGDMVSMYAEISELREQTQAGTSPPVASSSSSSNSNSSSLGNQSEHKGPRVRVNSQGKFIYDSDSLKRRKGAHTTFAPGPYVKETESALPEIVCSEIESNSGGSKIAKTTTTAAAKLLFLNGGPAATRKIANVRPIVSTTPTRIIAQPTTAATTFNNMPSTAAANAHIEEQQQQQSQPHHQMNYNAFISQQQSSTIQKNLLANHTNPFYQPSTATMLSGNQLASTMMPSPSTKSTSSTGSTTSSSASTHTSGSASSTEEGFQRFYRSNSDQAAPMLQYQPTYARSSHCPTALMDTPSVSETDNGGSKPETTSVRQQQSISVSPFQRNAPVYWTLQNRRQTKPQSSSVTCRDDLYATPIRRSERMARAEATVAAANSNNNNNNNNNSNISPIVPRGAGFSTSTPTKSEDDSPERLNTCADRIGQSKTSLMDFKKLLLAKSAKTSPIQKRLSAVELLKKTTPNAPNAAGGDNINPVNSATAGPATMQTMNSSMKLLDLSGSPKTFANRRMLRQGQFGSPSKSFAPKLKASGVGGWRNNSAVQRTDIMSTTIPEANNEDSNTSGGSNSSRASSVSSDKRLSVEASEASEDVISPTSMSYDMKRNFFLQNEENNFMRSEIKQHPNFVRPNVDEAPMPPNASSPKPLQTALETAL